MCLFHGVWRLLRSLSRAWLVLTLFVRACLVVSCCIILRGVYRELWIVDW